MIIVHFCVLLQNFLSRVVSKAFRFEFFFSKGALRKILGEADCQGEGGVWPKCQPSVQGGRGGPKLAKIASADI